MNPLVMMQSLGALALLGSIGRAESEVLVESSEAQEIVLDSIPDLDRIEPPARYHEPYSGYSSARQERRAYEKYSEKAEAKKKATLARRRMGGGRP